MPAFLEKYPEGTPDSSPGLNAGRKPALCPGVKAKPKISPPPRIHSAGEGQEGGMRFASAPEEP